jgi:hypothetical protein
MLLHRTLLALSCALFGLACGGNSSVSVAASSTQPGSPGTVGPPQEIPLSTPAAGGSVDIGKKEAPNTELGYDVQVIGDKTRWKRCASKDQCGTDPRERPSSEVAGTEPVGQARLVRPDGSPGDLVDIVRLKFR